MSWCAWGKIDLWGGWTGSCLGQGICTHTWVGQNCLCNWASNLSKSRYSISVDSLIMGWQNDDAWLLFWGSSTALANNVKERSWTQAFRHSNGCDSSLISCLFVTPVFLHPDPEGLERFVFPQIRFHFWKYFGRWYVCCLKSYGPACKTKIITSASSSYNHRPGGYMERNIFLSSDILHSKDFVLINEFMAVL